MRKGIPVEELKYSFGRYNVTPLDAFFSVPADEVKECENKLIDFWKRGGRSCAGTVGNGYGFVMRNSTKRRMSVIIYS